MCGRLVMSSTPADFIDYLQSTGALGDISIKNAFKNSFIPRYNVAPGAKIFAITNSRDEEGLEINMFKWGLVPPVHIHWGHGVQHCVFLKPSGRFYRSISFWAIGGG